MLGGLEWRASEEGIFRRKMIQRNSSVLLQERTSGLSYRSDGCHSLSSYYAAMANVMGKLAVYGMQLLGQTCFMKAVCRCDDIYN